MFFAAVARPIKEKNFDGRIYMKAIVSEKEMKRSSKYAKKGEKVSEPTTLNKESFIKICSDELLTAIYSIIQKLNLKIKKVTVQMDQAGIDKYVAFMILRNINTYIN